MVFYGSALPSPAQTAPAAVHHEANFDAERSRANELFLAQKPLEALPLYEDLCRQDPTIAVFAERHGAGLLTKASTVSDPAESAKLQAAGMAEIKRAQLLGDNSDYVKTVLSASSKTLFGTILSGVSLTPGYSYAGKPESQAILRKAEADFGRADLTDAIQLYTQAAAIDPAWYAPALYAGDCYFRAKDIANAGVWFAKAIAIDPDRETAYRYWGDALMQAGDANGAREKYVEAVVAEPYGQPAQLALAQWARRTGHQVVRPAITRPELSFKIDPALAASTQDGRASWAVYVQYRIDHGATTLNQWIVAGGTDTKGVIHPNGYVHTVAEEHAALRAMLADIDAKIKAGTLVEANLDASIRNIRALEQGNVLGAWIAINSADAGIRSDYPEYRSHHRKHLVEYVNRYLVQ